MERACGGRGVVERAAFDVDRAALPVPRLVPELLVVLEPAERGQARLPRPLRDAEPVEIGRLGPDGGDGVHRRGPADHAAAWELDAAVALAEVAPVVLEDGDAEVRGQKLGDVVR